MPDKKNIHELSDELGVTAWDNSGGIILWDLCGYSPRRLISLASDEVIKLKDYIDHVLIAVQTMEEQA